MYRQGWDSLKSLARLRLIQPAPPVIDVETKSSSRGGRKQQQNKGVGGGSRQEKGQAAAGA